MKLVIDKIIESLDSNLQEKGNFVQFNDDSYRSIPLEKKNFHIIEETNSSSKVAFIDGGNAEILKAPNFSLQFIRISYVIYQDNKKVSSKKHEFYILINSKNKDGKIIYDTQFFGSDNDKLEFDSFDETIRQGKHRISISAIGNVIRRLSELQTAKEVMDQLNSKDMIVLDGDLKASMTYELEYFNTLYKKAGLKQITIAALSKTSELFTETGNALIPVLQDLATISRWYYFPLVDINNNLHPIDMFIVKLHKNSKHIFKFEIYKKIGYKINTILSTLSSNSKDPVFLGYPYGLIEADKLARISNNEKEHLKTFLLVKLGKKREKISNYLNTTEAHSILDSISY